MMLMPSFQNIRFARELARGMFGDPQAKDAGLDQPADIAQRPAPSISPVLPPPA